MCDRSIMSTPLPPIPMPSGHPATDLLNAPTKGYFLATVAWLLGGMSIAFGLIAGAQRWTPQISPYAQPVLWALLLICGAGSFVVGILASHERRDESSRANVESPEFAALKKWRTDKEADESLTDDRVAVNDVSLEMSDLHNLKVSMEIRNMGKDPITVAGVCMNWVKLSDHSQMIAHALTIQPGEMKDLVDGYRADYAFQLISDFNNIDRRGTAWVSLVFTQNRIRWKQWGKAVDATFRA